MWCLYRRLGRDDAPAKFRVGPGRVSEPVRPSLQGSAAQVQPEETLEAGVRSGANVYVRHMQPEVHQERESQTPFDLGAQDFRPRFFVMSSPCSSFQKYFFTFYQRPFVNTHAKHVRPILFVIILVVKFVVLFC